MRTSRWLRGVLLLAALILFPQMAARADSAYVCTLGGSFGVLDFGAHTYTALGSTPAVCSGLGFDSADNLYLAESSTGRFFKINPVNGSDTVVGSGTGATNWVMAALTTGALYEIDAKSNLYSLNPATGIAASLGKIGLPSPSGSDAGGLGGSAGVLYYTFNDASLPDMKSTLYKIDPASCCAAQQIGSDTGFNFIGELGFVNGTLYGFDNAGKNVLKIDTTTGLATVLFAFPGAIANDKVFGAADVTLGQRLPGRFSAGAPGGQIIAVNVDASNGFNLAPYDYGPFVQTASVATIPSASVNGTMAFASGRAGGGVRVYVMNADGSGVRQITFADSTGADDTYPAISPDGTKVAFIASRAVANKTQFHKIFVVNIDGTGLRQVDAVTFDINGNSGDYDESFAWSPDSNKLAFRATRLSNICNPKAAPGFQDIVGIINLDGTGEKDLACDQAPHGTSALDWSPDGNLIAFSRSTDLGDPSVVVIDPTGAGKYSFTFAQVGACGSPRCIHFSPDSKRLAFQSGSFNGISIINLDGTGRTDSAYLTYSPDNFWWAPGPAFPKAVKMTLTPDPVQVWPGHTQQLTPTLLDASGNVITHAVEGFASQGGYCETIDAAGLASVSPSAVNNVAAVAAVNGGLTSNTVTVDCLAQQPPCTYSLSSMSQTVPAAGGGNSVTVSTQTGCAWTAVSKVSWITIVSGASGSGNGTVTYSFLVNTGPVRSGAVTIAGLTFTVNQGGVLPAVGNGGIVNNASYNLVSANVAPGSIAAVFGANLTDGTSCTLATNCYPTFDSTGKLNTTMAGAQVTANGIPLPIFYATPLQLGVQIPVELTGASATVQVSVAGQPSPPQTVSLDTFAPGTFTATMDGKGPGAFTHVDGSAVTAQSPAQRGELVILYATGLGQVTPAVPTGALPAGISNTIAPVTLTIGGINVTPDFAGLSGCCVGLNQINARIPLGVSPGNAVPVVLSIGGRSSNPATIAVQ